MIMNMPANSFFLYYVGFFAQAAIVVGLGLYWYIRDMNTAKQPSHKEGDHKRPPEN